MISTVGFEGFGPLGRRCSACWERWGRSDADAGAATYFYLKVVLQDLFLALRIVAMFDGPSTTELDPAERRARLRLARSPRIGPVTFHEALQHFGSARAPAGAASRWSREAAIAREEAGARARSAGASWCWATPTIPPRWRPCPMRRRSCRRSATWRCSAGRRWPSSARAKPRSPAAASPPSLRPRLGKAGFAIVSGLARGIDAAAHEAALPTGTVAVLAGGIDQVYPPQNAGLQQRHRRARPVAGRRRRSAPRPIARSFPRRNRIVSGLAAGVVVIEAAERSGSLITAQRAARTGPRGVRRAGLADGPALCRIQ